MKSWTWEVISPLLQHIIFKKTNLPLSKRKLKLRLSLPDWAGWAGSGRWARWWGRPGRSGPGSGRWAPRRPRRQAAQTVRRPALNIN